MPDRSTTRAADAAIDPQSLARWKLRALLPHFEALNRHHRPLHRIKCPHLRIRPPTKLVSTTGVRDISITIYTFEAFLFSVSGYAVSGCREKKDLIPAADHQDRRSGKNAVWGATVLIAAFMR